jgi:hypothetical protein
LQALKKLFFLVHVYVIPGLSSRHGLGMVWGMAPAFTRQSLGILSAFLRPGGGWS